MAEYDPAHNGLMPTGPDSDPEDDAFDKAPPEPLSNPASPYKLVTETYDTLEDLKSDLREFTALAGFNIVRLKASNKVEGLSYSIILFSCQRGNDRASKTPSRASSTTKLGYP